jgi:hypothetical protein
MGHATEGIHKIVKDMDEDAKKRFVDDWSAKLADDLDATLRRIKDVVERDAAERDGLRREESAAPARASVA